MRRLLILAIFVCGAVYAYAGPVEFEFVAWNDGNWQNGYPYYISELNHSTLIMVMCDDYAHGGMPGDQWMANITDLGTGNISLTRFNLLAGPNSLYPLMLYNEAGWLLLETQQEPMSQWLPMNYAVWNIFDAGAPCNSACQAWESAAQSSVKGLPQSFFNDVFIVTPVNQHDPNDNDIQEFMYIGESSSSAGNDVTAPEPGTLLLMGSGLVAAFGRKFLK